MFRRFARNGGSENEVERSAADVTVSDRVLGVDSDLALMVSRVSNMQTWPDTKTSSRADSRAAFNLLVLFHWLFHKGSIPVTRGG